MLSEKRVEAIRHAVGQTTLSRRGSPQERQAAISAVRVTDLGLLRSPAELRQSVNQLEAEAAEVKKALQMEDDL